jgi:hypothetical protein
MVYSAFERCIQIDHAHGAAICEEIGERLRAGLDPKSERLPLQLLKLVARLRDGRAQHDAKRPT